MTSDVIDGAPSSACAGGMDDPVVPFRYDASLRVVIWTDAALSAALALVAVLSPVVIVLPLPPGATTGVGLAALAAAVVLAGLGAVTAVLLMMRMRAGHGFVPPGLRLPLPAAMCPDLGEDLGPGEGVGLRAASGPGTRPGGPPPRPDR